jgi:DNA-binding winged helix-turn-helix (wHTH) protein
VYQALPAPADPPGGAQIVLVIDVPAGVDATAAEAVRLADEFGATISHWLPGVRARKAVLTAGSPTRTIAAPPATGLLVDLANRRVSIDGRPVRLAYREYALLAYLAAAPHRTISRTTLLGQVWRDRQQLPEPLPARTVDTHIRRLRAKLGEHAHVLTTVRGHGYRFDPGADVQLHGDAVTELAN